VLAGHRRSARRRRANSRFPPRFNSIKENDVRGAVKFKRASATQFHEFFRKAWSSPASGAPRKKRLSVFRSRSESILAMIFQIDRVRLAPYLCRWLLFFETVFRARMSAHRLVEVVSETASPAGAKCHRRRESFLQRVMADSAWLIGSRVRRAARTQTQFRERPIRCRPTRTSAITMRPVDSNAVWDLEARRAGVHAR